MLQAQTPLSQLSCPCLLYSRTDRSSVPFVPERYAKIPLLFQRVCSFPQHNGLHPPVGKRGISAVQIYQRYWSALLIVLHY